MPKLRSFITPFIERQFLFSYYENFLKALKDTGSFEIVPLKAHKSTSPLKKTVISLRHDVDCDIWSALEMAKLEYNYGIQSTYFILHTSEYYGITKKGYTKHHQALIPYLKKIQNEYGHEIAWHNDLVTLQIIYEIDPIEYFAKELEWLRRNGLTIVGTSSHGSHFCTKHGYHNSYFFYEFSNRKQDLPNNESVLVKNRKIMIRKSHLANFGLEYDAYHLDNNIYYSDASFVGRMKRRFHPKEIKLKSFFPSDKIIVLTHPVHWDKSLFRKLTRTLKKLTAV